MMTSLYTRIRQSNTSTSEIVYDVQQEKYPNRQTDNTYTDEIIR
jgi:hypothetical protein